MNEISNKSVDMILCDLPYGTTACKWDSVIPFQPLWNHYERIIKDNGAIVLFGSQPFTAELIHSNLKLFKYELIWNKVNISNPLLAKKQVLKSHENILVFYKKQPTYNPQMVEGTIWHRGGKSNVNIEALNAKMDRTEAHKSDSTNLKYPKSIVTYSNADNTKRLHPTQKPVGLCEWLIRTYSKEGDLILDNCMGSGSTGVAALNTKRRFIGIELDPTYCGIAKDRIQHIVSGIS